MTKYVVKAVWNTTSKLVAVPGRTEYVALENAKHLNHTRGASVFVVYERTRSGLSLVLTGKR